MRWKACREGPVGGTVSIEPCRGGMWRVACSWGPAAEDVRWKGWCGGWKERAKGGGVGSGDDCGRVRALQR